MNFKIWLPLGTAAFMFARVAFGWTYQDIRTIVEGDRSIRQVEDLLPHLDSELLSNYLLLHRSNSLQEASLNEPRVILFSNDGNFLMAFNGGGDLVGHDRLEMIEFNQNEKKFEFHSLRFPDTAEGNVVFSEKNPPECQGCHRDDLRPNWDSYPFWKDAYGSIEDSAHQRVDEFPETSLLQSFLSGAAQNVRYRSLIGLQSQSVERMAHRNLDFNRAVGFRNFQKIAQYLRTTPDYSKYMYALFGALQNCDVGSFIPAEIQRTFAHDLTYYLDDATATEQRIRHDRKDFVLRTETFYEPRIVGSMRYLLEGRGVSTGSWSMVLGAETFSLSTGSAGIKDMVPIILAQNPELRGQGCNDLQRKSLSALRQ